MTELDSWQSANILLKRYGAEAVFIVSKRTGSKPLEIARGACPVLARCG